MNNDVKLSLIVARGRNNVIGVAGQLPWRLKSDLMFFKQVTLGKPAKTPAARPREYRHDPRLDL